jgi:anti-sigma factor RsiW
MTCHEIADFLLAYLNDELSARRRRAFEAHLAECEQCVDYIESYKATVELGKAAFDRGEPIPEGVPEELIEAIMAARASERPGRGGR